MEKKLHKSISLMIFFYLFKSVAYAHLFFRILNNNVIYFLIKK